MRTYRQPKCPSAGDGQINGGASVTLGDNGVPVCIHQVKACTPLVLRCWWREGCVLEEAVSVSEFSVLSLQFYREPKNISFKKSIFLFKKQAGKGFFMQVL